MMRKQQSILVVLSLLAVLFATLFPTEQVNAQCPGLTFTIDGAQAANGAGTGSAATGTGTVTIDTATRSFSWNINYNAANLINGAGSVTAAHFHGPAVAGSSAGIQVGIGTANPNSGSTTLTPAQMSDLMAGLWYVNVHTTAVGGGEIRGQVHGCTAAALTLQETSTKQPTNFTPWFFAGATVVLLAGTFLIIKRNRAAKQTV